MTLDQVRTRLLAYLPDEAYDKEIGSVNYGLMTAFAGSLNDAYDQNDSLHTQVGVNTATGTFLDELGRIFKIQRQSGETDTELRNRIKSFWVAFSGGGTADSIKNAVGSVLEIDPLLVSVVDIPDLKFMVTFPVPVLGPIIGTVRETVVQAKDAGVYPLFTATVLIADEGVEIAESLIWTPSPAIIVSAYDIGSDAYV